MAFIDEMNLVVSSGKGGAGCISFRRESHIPRGGPDGGDGGRGGHVIFKVASGLNSLFHLKRKNKYVAGDGQPGQGRNQTGADGSDLVINVPKGTIIKSMNGEILHDLSDPEEFLFLEGGLGGKGNCFYKSSVNQAPEKAQKGLPGETQKIKLELKLIADVGLLGFPNAGKSTLISVLSSAKPKIADYPFTTLVPNLGVVQLSEEADCVMADIPGLIKGASEGVGLGYQFLKHVERTKLLVHLIDVSEFSGRDPWQDFVDINNELEKYSLKSDSTYDLPIFERPQIVVFNKVDTVTVEKLKEIEKVFLDHGVEPLFLSAVTGENLSVLKYKILNQLQELA